MKRVLIVDDAITVRMYHREIVESLGMATEEAENGIEALETAMTTTVDLFLVDVNMPKMDGYRFLQEVRRNPELQAIPAIMISTEDKQRDREKAYLAGANLYLTKPVASARLKDIVNIMAGGK